MKFSKLAITFAMASGLTVTSALAQSGLRQPASVQRTGFEYGSYDYYAQEDNVPSPGARKVAHGGGNGEATEATAIPEAAPAPASSKSCGCSTGSTCNSCNSCNTGCNDCLECEDEEPHRLFEDCCILKECGISITGWVDQGFTANFDDPADRFNGPVTFNDRSNEYLANQVYAIIQKPIDTEACGLDLGGRVDLLYGSDYRFTIARGLDAEDDDFTGKWNSSRFYGLAMPQAYAELGYDDLSLKVGHFYTVIGYEVVTAPDNFFYSHAYTFQYGEPFTHTGFLFTYAANDQLSLNFGMTNGWDNFEDVYEEHGFLGGITFQNEDASRKLAFATHIGEEETVFGAGEVQTTDRDANPPAAPTESRYVQSVVYTAVLDERNTYIFQSDYGHQEDAFELNAPGTAIPLGIGEDAEWYGINQYWINKINCCWSQGVRVEWFRDDDGFRVAPVGDFPDRGPAENNNTAGAGGFEGNFWNVTYGLNWTPTANLKIRPELRYDWYDGDENFLGNDPYDDGSDDDQFLAAFDVIYLW